MTDYKDWETHRALLKAAAGVLIDHSDDPRLHTAVMEAIYKIDLAQDESVPLLAQIEALKEEMASPTFKSMSESRRLNHMLKERAERFEAQLAIAKEALKEFRDGPLAFWRRSRPYSTEFDLLMERSDEKASAALAQLEGR